jgi:O-antigen ligase
MPLALARESATERNWWQYDYVHNVPVLVAVETGLIGLAAWLGFAVTMLLVVRDRLLHKTALSSGVTVYAASFIAMLVASLFDHFLWSSWFGQLLFWTVAGLLHAAYLNLRKTR